MAKHLLVVGAGVFGLFGARAALAAGWRVTVIDPRPAPAQVGGACASASAAGMLGPISETLIEPAPSDPAHLQRGIEALQLWASLGPGLFGPSYALSGALHVGGRDHAEALVALAERARAVGLEAQILRGGAVRGGWSGLGFAASIAVRIPDEALIQPVAALSRLEKLLGGACRFGVRLEALEPDGAAWRARTTNAGTIAADEVLLAAGYNPALVAYAPSLAPLQPAAGAIAALRAPAPLNTVVRGPGFYLAPRGGGEVVLGSSMQFGVTDLKPDVSQLRKLAARLFVFSPAMKTAPEAARWAGVRAVSPDWSPLIGRDPTTGLLVAAGAGRNGWLYGPLAGEMIAALLSDRPVPAQSARFDPSRFSSATPPSHA